MYVFFPSGARCSACEYHCCDGHRYIQVAPFKNVYQEVYDFSESYYDKKRVKNLLICPGLQRSFLRRKGVTPTGSLCKSPGARIKALNRAHFLGIVRGT